MSEQVQHTPTGQQAYGLLMGTYGYINATTFAHALVDGRGHAHWLSCQLMAWIMDWYRPTNSGEARFHGRLFVPSTALAHAWNVTPRAVEDARAVITRAGLLTFHSVQHTCWVEPHWDAIADACRLHAEQSRLPENREPQSRLPENRESGQSRLPENRESEAPDSRKTGTILLLPTPSKVSPPSEEEVCCTVSDEVRSAAERMVAFGVEHGRQCTGQWAEDAVTATAEVVASGHELAVTEAAWRAYAAEHGPRATDLAHWLRGQNLRGQTASEGPWGYAEAYRREAERARALAERQRVAAGGVPSWRAQHLVGGGWVVDGGGEVWELAEMSKAEALAEATRRWGAAHPGTEA